MIVVDTNVLLDLFAPVGDGTWARRAMAASASRRKVVNPVIVAEFAPRFTSHAEQLDYLRDLKLDMMPIDGEAAYRAGTAHQLYRRQGGERTAILADFLIAGHAISLGASLMTRDRGRFASYFPELTLITPETSHG